MVHATKKKKPGQGSQGTSGGVIATGFDMVFLGNSLLGGHI